MKKIILSILIIFLMFTSMVPSVNASEIQTDFLSYFLFDYKILNDKDPNVFNLTDYTNINGKTVQKWFVGIAQLVIYINESYTADEMVSYYKNNIEIINNTIKTLETASGLLEYGYKDATGEMYVNVTENINYMKDLKIDLGNGKGTVKFSDIVKDRESFNTVVSYAKQKLNTVIRNINNLSSGNIEANSYETLFKYNKQDICDFLEKYRDNYGLTNQNEINIIQKLWKIKTNLEDTDKLATRRDIFIKEDDDYYTKLTYDFEKVRLYIALFGKDPKCSTQAETNNLQSEWSYMLANNGEHTTKYKGWQASGGQQKYSNENGDKTALTQYVAAKEISDSEWQELLKGDIEKREDNGAYYEQIYNGYNGKYTIPTRTSSVDTDDDNTKSTDLDAIIDSADKFVSNGENEKIKEEDIQNLSNTIYNVLLIVGIIIAVIVGAIIGIKFMVGSVEEKANIKEVLVPYIVGCVVVFGAFGIWKLAVTILAGI